MVDVRAAAGRCGVHLLTPTATADRRSRCSIMDLDEEFESKGLQDAYDGAGCNFRYKEQNF